MFLDTPGVVTKEEATKFHLEESLLVDPVAACQDSDLIILLQVLHFNLRSKLSFSSLFSTLRD